MHPLEKHLNNIKILLGDREAKKQKNDLFSPAAVNIILFPVEDELSVIFTRRSDKVPTHKKQISFPGGQRDEEDTDLWETAIRETDEEIGLETDKFEFIGRLDDYLTISFFNVRPYVSYYNHSYPLTYKIQKNEIDYILEIPLSDLQNENNWQIIKFSLNGNHTGLPHFWYHGNVIWGVTGFILFDFLKKIKQLPSFEPVKDFRIEDIEYFNKINHKSV